MISAALPSNETQRQKALNELGILDTQPEQAYDEIVQLASHICETPISLITLLDNDRQWFKSCVGLDVSETSRTVAFCAHAIQKDEIFEVKNALTDERFFDNPLVTNNPDIRFYAGMPLTTSKGFKLGTLCVIDTVPRELNQTQRKTLQVLSHQVIKEIELRQSHIKMENQALELQKLNGQNAKLLTIIAHDLRSPLASIKQIADMLTDGDIPTEVAIDLIKETGLYVEGTLALLDNLLAWAKQQFSNADTEIKPLNVALIFNEKAKRYSADFAAKGNTIEISAPQQEVAINENVLRLLIRNLLVNANKFTQNGTITLSATVEGNTLSVSVTDTGKGMDATQLANLFDWDKRSSTVGTGGEKGLGIGLQLCKDLLETQGGSITVDSKVGKGSTFLFTLPIGGSIH